ncbi:hypothetical protein LSTR_LSTR002519 [Laodelphax striatellus]|uniref:Uncharacterized protein n=1 Tax=Laodelphax striatellus TaxID=195883 RepID=A0A482XL55_LAOST|nr:hypothetical protein LSTR_LSTR002519 [Laodelphax striatellus]
MPSALHESSGSQNGVVKMPKCHGVPACRYVSGKKLLLNFDHQNWLLSSSLDLFRQLLLNAPGCSRPSLLLQNGHQTFRVTSKKRPFVVVVQLRAGALERAGKPVQNSAGNYHPHAS